MKPKSANNLRKKAICEYESVTYVKISTFVKDMSSGTMYGERFTNGARSMYISKSSGPR